MIYEFKKGECMKKHIAIILSVVLVVMFASVLIVALTTRKNNNVIRVNEVTHSIFYAPFYIAINNNYFEEEGLTLELVNGGGSNNSMNALVSGEADIALLGPETAIYVERAESTDAPKMFAQLTKRDGSFLISKTATDNFEWTDLIDTTIIGGRRGGVPAMTLQYVIEQIAHLTIGTGAGEVNLRTDVEFNLTASVYESTDAQYCTLFEPNASALVAENKGHMVASVGRESGEVPYTGFAAKQSYMNANQTKIESFIRAIIRGYNYLTTANIDDIVLALQPSFATTSADSIRSAILSYIEIDAWADSPVMKESAFNYLQTIMMNAGELEQQVAFGDVVDNSFATRVLAEFD